MSEKIDVLGVAFDNLTMDEAVETAYAIQSEHRGAYVVTPLFTSTSLWPR